MVICTISNNRKVFKFLPRMDLQTLVFIYAGQENLSCLTINGLNAVNGVDASPEVKSLPVKTNNNDCLYNDKSDEDEGKPKLRKRNPENWKQNVRKRNKNKGLEYINVNGKMCKRKMLGPPCTCKEKCYLKIGKEACEKVFENFWKLGDYSLQNAYIAGCVRIFLPKHCYRKDGLPSRRFFSRNFYVTVNGVDTEVCKQAFLNLHAISNGRLDRLLKKKQEIGNTGFDERGRHSNKVNKIPIEKIRLVREHINSVRKRAGFTGKRKPKKVELLPYMLNIRTMYRSYKEETLAKGLQPVCEYRYRKIFHSDFHLDFGKPVVTSSNASEEGNQLNKPQQKEQQQQTLPFNRVVDEKYISKRCQEDNDMKKIQTVNSVSLQNMIVDLEMMTNIKPVDRVQTYSQPESDATEKNLMGSSEIGQTLPQDFLRLDYVSYNPQTNCIFPN